jgi:hypothetical protein
MHELANAAKELNLWRSSLFNKPGVHIARRYFCSKNLCEAGARRIAAAQDGWLE